MRNFCDKKTARESRGELSVKVERSLSAGINNVKEMDVIFNSHIPHKCLIIRINTNFRGA